MKTFKTVILKTLIFLCVLLGNINGYAQSCVITRVPSSASLPIGGGTTYQFSLILCGGCTPIFTKSASWLSYTYVTSDYTHGLLTISASANPGPPRTGYVYVDNKESLKITIDQAGSYVNVTGVAVLPTVATINVNATTTLTATVSPANATNKSVTWTSSNTAVATVSSTGVVTGKAAGTATITATSSDNGNIKATATIYVSAMPLSFKSSYITLAKNQRVDGPCFIFAAVGAVEAWYKKNQNCPACVINLAEGQIVNGTSGNPAIHVPEALEYIRVHGIVNEECSPYESCYFFTNLTTPPCANPALTVTIPGFTSFNLQSISVDLRADYLKNLIIQKGTLPIAFQNTSLHSGAAHAYELCGWQVTNGITQWWLKDSWPGTFATYLAPASIDIPQILATASQYINSCYIGSGLKASINSKLSEFNESNNLSHIDKIDNTNQSLKNIYIYPNPASGEITLVNFPTDVEFVKVYKADGSLAFSGKINGDKIDISKFPKGLYFVKLSTNKNYEVLKFIKQ